jgi:hypothetical protein
VIRRFRDPTGTVVPSQRAPSPPPHSRKAILGGVGGLAVAAGIIALIAALNTAEDGRYVPPAPRPPAIRPDPMRSPRPVMQGPDGNAIPAGPETPE